MTGEDPQFPYDVFLSFDSKDEQLVRDIRSQFQEAGLRTFFAPDDLSRDMGRADWQRRIFDALRDSFHLAVYCSTNGLTSSWVHKEVSHFLTCAQETPATAAERRILVLPDDRLHEADLQKRLDGDPILRGLLRPKTVTQALLWLTNRQITTLREMLDATRTGLEQANILARQSFDYYRHARFWKPFSESRELHVFTCGRDVSKEATHRGGRTNIDKWDYQASVDITHHFALHYRTIGVEIEQPVSKTRIDEKTRLFDTHDFSSMLANKNCVIIGSPDVSDFAEVALAKLVNVRPYHPEEQPRTGFRIIKKGQSFSTFYESTSNEVKEEGIRLVAPEGERTFICSEGRSYGILVLADNPFSSPKMAGPDKILILAGHTGVSTRAISLLLTEEEPWCLDVFYELDRAIAVMQGPVAAVVEVNYVRQNRGDSAGDDRFIPPESGSINFKSAVELRPQ